jgi:hypothetical protein
VADMVLRTEAEVATSSTTLTKPRPNLCHHNETCRSNRRCKFCHCPGRAVH